MEDPRADNFVRAASEEPTDAGTEILYKETGEQFEDGILNKRAAQLHLRLRETLEETPQITFSTLTRKEHTRKAAARQGSIKTNFW